MAEIVIPNMREGYATIVEAVLAGDRVSPRGHETREIMNAMIRLQDPTDAIPLGSRPKLNLAIGAAESVHLIGGLSDAQQLVNVTKNFQPFVREHRLLGAYGPRIARQIPWVLQRLTDDTSSRQAGVMIWRDDELLLPDNPDVPCTVFLQWVIRDGRLSAITHMRSNDVWLGTPYDIMMFTNLQLALCYVLSIPPGEYIHCATSLHAYERDVKKLHDLGAPAPREELPPPFAPPVTRRTPRTAARAVIRWKMVRRAARHCVVPLETKNADKRLPGAHWYAERLASTQTKGTRWCTVCNYVLPARYFWTGWEGRVRAVCKECAHARQEEKMRLDADFRLKSRVKRYGITVEDYKAMVLDQENVCAICKHPPHDGRWTDFLIDHDHQTKAVRGLLCTNCNMTLGHMKDDPVRLREAADYLERGKGDS